ncbi:hypothetical protein B0H13DRAFT_1884193 [Mycena leptocephala]|nr:hypothetical protein B0H13DRAFT_1884193 [Mycena leptocephala]
MPLSLVNLLNPSDAEGQRVQAEMEAGLVDIQPQLQRLAAFPAHSTRATPDVQEKLLSAIAYLEAHRVPIVNNLPPTPQRPPSPSPDEGVEINVKLTSKTTLAALYRYPAEYILEYPETSTANPVGHLFRMDPENWLVPDLNIAYSRGILWDGHWGQGGFFSPMVDKEGNQAKRRALYTPHSSFLGQRSDTPKTGPRKSPSNSSLSHCLRKLGCSRPLAEASLRQRMKKRSDKQWKFTGLKFNAAIDQGFAL